MGEMMKYIIFFHVLGAIIWVGGMIAIRFAVHPSMQHIDDDHIRLARLLEITGRLFGLVLPFIVIILITGLYMAHVFGFSGHTDLSTIVHVKEAIWLVMTLNYAGMVWLRFKAQSYYLASNYLMAKKMLAPIAKYMLPLNIFLGVMALYFGLVLRGF
ncbi:MULTISPECIES: hypothetical protein [unclassified Nitratiruptor]|uniref:hypothetical protein n=1 Tax=unclassified Nitratiruptor TaxID=2624044 RepID=UPI001914DD02|nr:MULTISPECIES: hypothetical protein [unclassified Nitratiruptor]BCD60830.1 hypothetical protein NitYY0810_C1608 [Nitratiruptor sp. YY08-10]BCD64762.1 hypothetical protein NitYY0814_C1616 [Nitratiruptor sp. YY08-14]